MQQDIFTSPSCTDKKRNTHLIKLPALALHEIMTGDRLIQKQIQKEYPREYPVRESRKRADILKGVNTLMNPPSMHYTVHYTQGLQCYIT